MEIQLRQVRLKVVDFAIYGLNGTIALLLSAAFGPDHSKEAMRESGQGII